MTTPSFSSTATTFVQLRGSDTVLALIKPIAYQYMKDFPKVGIPTMAGGTLRGYKTAMDGTTDIGMVSGGISPELAKWARKQKIKIQTIPIAYDALAVIVHPSSQVENLTLEQLQDIFTGQISDWKQLGLNEGPIQVYTQSPNRGSFESWRTIVLEDKATITPKAKTKDGLDIISSVAQDRNGIGFTSPVNVVGKPVKIIAINDFHPHVEQIQTEKYPIRRSLSLVALSKLQPPTQAFIDYCLAPNKGQAIIQKIGLVPIALSTK